MGLHGSGRMVTSFLAIGLFLCALAPFARGDSPSFSTLTPKSGVLGSTFVVLLPIVNMGTGTAGLVRVTSATLGRLRVSSPALPLAVGTMGSNDSKQLVLQFGSSQLTVGAKYLLTVRGTYQSGTATLGFAVNRILAVEHPSPPVQVDIQRWIALDAVRAEFASLPDLDPVADAQAMLTFLQSRPEFVESGIYPDSSSVFAEFSDGRAVIIANDRPVSSSVTSPVSDHPAPGTGSAASNGLASQARSTQLSGASLAVAKQAAASGDSGPSELPMSSQARLLDALTGTGYIDNFVVTDLFSWLIVQGYTPPEGADASVASLKTVGGDGIFYFATHGGFLGTGLLDDPHVYALWTSTPSDIAKDLDFADDLFPPDRLVYMFAKTEKDLVTGKWIKETHYGITSEFVKKYWPEGTFGTNSLVYIDACNSANFGAQDFKNAVLAAGAGVYVGWTYKVDDDDAGNAARLVFDRLLGANQYCPETNPAAVTDCVPGSATPPIFAQRPFNYVGVLTTEFKFHDNVGRLSPIEFLDFVPGSGSSFGLLAPSISNMAVQEYNGQNGQLTLNGTFGQNPNNATNGGSPGDGVVTVGGPNSPANIESWDTHQIVVDLNLSGAGSSGDVLVEVRGHKSNVARLTDWRGHQFTYTFSENGSLQVQTIYNLHLRADIRQWRNRIHFPPVEPNAFISSANDSTAVATGSGSASATAGDFSLSGSVNLVNFFAVPRGAEDTIVLAGDVTDHTQMTLVSLGALPGIVVQGPTCKLCQMGNCVSSEIAVFGPSNAPSVSAPFYFTFALDPDTAKIAQGSFFAANLAPECNSDLPINGAHGLFQWGRVPATDNTAPDPTSAR